MNTRAPSSSPVKATRKAACVPIGARTRGCSARRRKAWRMRQAIDATEHHAPDHSPDLGRITKSHPLGQNMTFYKMGPSRSEHTQLHLIRCAVAAN